jgi:RNA polymerase sigma-70 factor (ECF subfamily)
MPTREEVLIKRSKEGDVTAFEELIRRYEDRIHGFSSRMCRQTEDAQDVFQETFLAAFKGLRNFKGRSRLATWFYKIASNACLKKRRKGKFEPRDLQSLDAFLPGSGKQGAPPQIADWTRSPVRQLEEKELRDALERAVADLPAEYRAVLVLRDMEGFSAQDTARALEISVAAVKSRLHRARLFIRQKMSEFYEKKGS